MLAPPYAGTERGHSRSLTYRYDTVLVIGVTSTTSVFSLTLVERLTGVGLTTGAQYTLHLTSHDAELNGEVRQIVISPTAYVQVTKGGEPNFAGHFLFQLVIDPNGVVRIDPESPIQHPSSAGCVG